MRISDWSSDVCSSDLVVTLERGGLGVPVPVGLESNRGDLAVARPAVGDVLGAAQGAAVEQNHVGVAGVHLVERCPDAPMIMIVGNGKSVVEGKSVSVRLAIGVRRYH